jgi:hypothetical protein
MASVANRVPAQTIEHADHRNERCAAKISTANLDLAKQAISTPRNKGKVRQF